MGLGLQFFMEAAEAVRRSGRGRLEVEDRDLPGSPSWAVHHLEGDPDGQFHHPHRPQDQRGCAVRGEGELRRSASRHTSGSLFGPSMHPKKGAEGTGNTDCGLGPC